MCKIWDKSCKQPNESKEDGDKFLALGCKESGYRECKINL